MTGEDGVERGEEIKVHRGHMEKWIEEGKGKAREIEGMKHRTRGRKMTDWLDVSKERRWTRGE